MQTLSYSMPKLFRKEFLNSMQTVTVYKLVRNSDMHLRSIKKLTDGERNHKTSSKMCQTTTKFKISDAEAIQLLK